MQHQMAASPEQRGEALLKDPELRRGIRDLARFAVCHWMCWMRIGRPQNLRLPHMQRKPNVRTVTARLWTTTLQPSQGRGRPE